MAFGEADLSASYFMKRLAATREAQHLPASAQFDLARSPLSDDELEGIVDQFRDSPRASTGWGLSEGLDQILSSQPKRIPVSDIEKLQNNLIAQGYAPPNTAATGTWDPTWYAAFRRWDRDNYEAQRAGRHWYSAPVEAGVRGIVNTLPSRVFQGIVGASKGIVTQAPETFERGGALGGAVAGGAVGAAVGSVVPVVGTGIGALAGAGIGATAGFLADLFGNDEGEEDQSGAERLLDALQPFNEYAEQGPRAFFEDLGWVLSTTSMITGAGAAAKGVTAGVAALNAARLAPAVAADGTLAAGNVLAAGAEGAASTTVQAAAKSPLSSVFLQQGAQKELGAFGAIARAATRRFAPGTAGALEDTMLKYSLTNLTQRLGPNIALKAFQGLTQAQMGARLFGGIGQGSTGEFAKARDALKASLGRDLTEDEQYELAKKTGATAIERSIAEAPRLESGIDVPFLGDLVDVSAAVLYPGNLLPFRGASIAKSAVNLMGDTSLMPFAHAVQSQTKGMGLSAAVTAVKENLTPLDVAWLKHDYGLKQEALLSIERARLSPEKAFRTNALANARADVIRTIKSEHAAGTNATLSRVMSYADADPTNFTAFLVDLNGRKRGIDRLTAWKQANQLSRDIEKMIDDQTLLEAEGGRVLRAEALLPDETIDLPDGAGALVRPGQTKSVKARQTVVDKATSNVDRMSITDRIARLEQRATLYDRTANKGTIDPWTTISLKEQARLARSEAETLKSSLAKLDAAGTKRYVRTNITPARTEFADRATMFAKREQFLKLREEVIKTTDGAPNAHIVARKNLENYTRELAEEGFIPESMVKGALTGRPSDRIAKTLEQSAQHAARTIELPDDIARQFDELGYKAVETGEDVLFPDQLDRMWKVGELGDYSKRAQVWETLGMSPQFRSDRSLFRLRREHELSELTDVFAREDIRMSADGAMRRLHDQLQAINHDGAVIGPLRKGKTGKIGLYKVDVRDLSVDDILRAFDDVPGFNDETAMKVFGALRRGAAYGGEVKLMHPLDSARAIGRTMRTNGLPGFSDAIRTWHAEVPLKMSRRAWRRDEYVYRPEAEFARSPERARAEAALKTVAKNANVSEGQRNFGMRLLDSMAESQVSLGRFESVDDFYKHLDVGYAERYVAGDFGRALFRTRSDDELRFLVNTFKDDASWYERSSAKLAEIFRYGTKTKLPLSATGEEIDDLDLFAQILAATSPRTPVADNMTQAIEVFKMFKRGEETSWGQIPGVMKSKWKMLDDIASGRGPAKWDEATQQGVYKVDSAMIDGKKVTGVKGLPRESRERMKVWNFYHNLRGDLDKVTVDTWMGALFDADTITPAIYDNIERDIRALAKDTGMYPAQVQAALWAAAKEELGNAALKDAASFAELSAPLQKWVESHVRDVNGMKVLQRVEDEVMGATRYGEDFPTVMRFFRTADYATLVHEDAHLLRRLLPPEDVDALERAYGIRGPRTPHGPSDDLRSIAKEYHDESGVPFDRSAVAEYAEVDTERAKRIADQFENLKPSPKARATKRAYKAFANETMAQYELLKKHGYKLVPWGREGQPYANAAEFIKDVRENKRIYYFKTLQDDAFGAGKVTKEQIAENPLLADAGVPILDSEGVRYDQTYNDVFRAVHDIFGHAKEGLETGARGEENAWRQHARMYSDEARKAMTTETRGQNSWVNFGPHLRQGDGSIPVKGQKGYVRPQDRPFSDQKVMLLDDEFTRVDPSTTWSREAEERFARDAEEYILGKSGLDRNRARGSFDALRESVISLYRAIRPAAVDSNLVSRDVRQVLDKHFASALAAVPERRGTALLKSAGSKQVLGGAALGAATGAAEGDSPGDIAKGALLGAGGGLMARGALRKSYGYLPDYLTRLNTALRYTLSFTFDAGRYSEQNLIAMTKHGLPPMLSPTKYIKGREWKSPYSAGTITGEAAWKDAVKFWDEINGTTWFQNVDDLDRRMFQAGMLGFSPRNWEIAQAFQLHQRGLGSDKIREAISEIGRYGLGRTAAEKSANFVVFPFSFSKKLLVDLGDFMLQAPARNLLLHEGYRRYYESEANEKVDDFLDRHAPLVKQIAQINNLAFGISPGRFFLQGLSDHRTNVGKAMQIMASVFVPSGAATPLAQGSGGLGDLAVHAFSPIVISGESMSRAGGVESVQDVFERYIPFVRELDQYFTGEGAAVPAQITALSEGAEPYYQFSKYQDGLREAKAQLEPVATMMGYSTVDGLLQSDQGAVFASQLDSTKQELATEFPTGFNLSQTFENSDTQNQRALYDLANKSDRSVGEDHILQLAEDESRYRQMADLLHLDPSLVDAMLAKRIRDQAVAWSSDPRFAELYDRFFLRTYGPVRRVA